MTKIKKETWNRSVKKFIFKFQTLRQTKLEFNEWHEEESQNKNKRTRKKATNEKSKQTKQEESFSRNNDDKSNHLLECLGQLFLQEACKTEQIDKNLGSTRKK